MPENMGIKKAIEKETVPNPHAQANTNQNKTGKLLKL